MEHIELPEGWQVSCVRHDPLGDLVITITYDDHCSYTVWWDRYDSVTMTGSCCHGKRLAFDPTVMLMAMYCCVHRQLAPQYGQRAETGD
jgi:hypothetical protein